MISDLESILYKAEIEYLEITELNIFNQRALSLERRLKLYELLRDREIEIFEYIAEDLLKNYPQTDELKIALALQYWMSIMRHCSMAMLSNNYLYLENRILAWLPEQIEVDELKNISENIYILLSKCLFKILNAEDFYFLKPFLEQTKNILGE